MRFESDALTLEIPLPRLQMQISESEDGGIYFCDAEQPDWSIVTFDTDVLRQTPLLQQVQTRNQIREFRSRGELKRRLKITLYFVAGFALVAIIVSMLLGYMVRALVAKVPVEWEQELGDTLMQEVRKEKTFLTDRKLQAKLETAVAPLIKVLPQRGIEFRFYILEDPIPNAFALPGGHVLVNTGLLEFADRPEELAGVIAHEIAHVTEKHGFRKIISSAGPFLIFRMFLGGGSTGILGGSSQLLISQSFSQEYELEADAVGWQYLVAARIDPRGLTDMLSKLEAEQRVLKGLAPELQDSKPNGTN